jgi:toxin ParE1/3/4
MKPLVITAKADEDIDRALERCLEEQPHRFDALVDALETTFRRVARLPKAGSPRWALELRIDGLRSQATPRFPYTVAYVETSAEILVIRVLHQKRDLPTLLGEE